MGKDIIPQWKPILKPEEDWRQNVSMWVYFNRTTETTLPLGFNSLGLYIQIGVKRNLGIKI